MANHGQFSGCTISSRRCQCFEKLSEEETIQLNHNSVNIKYKKGEIICKQGGFASHVMYMEKGLAKVFIDNGVNSLVLKIIPDGNLLGLTSLSEEHNTFQYSALAYIDSEIKQIEINFFKQLLNRNIDFAKEVIDILSSNSVQVNGRFFCLTHKQSYGRLADIILCLSERIFKTGEFELPLSRKELAELSGMSSETVIRMLKNFKDEGLVEMKGKNFKVVDFDRLRRISETG
ncbi:MAG: Crp/Fnr family transcriptional regulator [Bacteroidales bacterium]|nr:Crp/Fnr family transcriptional regulator [Bacteroidales bacterium]